MRVAEQEGTRLIAAAAGARVCGTIRSKRVVAG